MEERRPESLGRSKTMQSLLGYARSFGLDFTRVDLARPLKSLPPE